MSGKVATNRLQHPKRKISPMKVSEKVLDELVVVGNYKTRQLDWIKKNGVYNYPVRDGDEFTPESFAKIRELWLYANVKSERHVFTAQFVGKMTNAEFLAAYPSYAKLGPSRQKAYYVFTTKPVDYPSELGSQIVIARAADFGGYSAKVKKAILQFKQDGEFAPLAAYLPKELGKVPRQQLRVCETAVQMDFMQTIFPERSFPSMSPLVYVAGGIEIPENVRAQTPQIFKMGEFFCGPGGLACGALSAKIECDGFRIDHAWANDYDAQTCETYRENICRENPESVICGDVRKLDLNDRRLTAIDGFAFGFPCNDFSVVGEHKGIDGNYGPLYQYGVAVLKKFRPRWFVAENVGGLASANEGAAFKKILASMKDAGYRIYPHLYKFEEYGVPQSRLRIIIVGIRSDLQQVFNPPSPALLAPRDNSAKAALENPPITVDAPSRTLAAQSAKVGCKYAA